MTLLSMRRRRHSGRRRTGRSVRTKGADLENWIPEMTWAPRQCSASKLLLGRGYQTKQPLFGVVRRLPGRARQRVWGLDLGQRDGSRSDGRGCAAVMGPAYGPQRYRAGLWFQFAAISRKRTA